MKYVVTGGAGFIGSNLVDKLLSEDHQVIILDNLSTGNIDNLSEKARESFIYKDIAMALPQELNRICKDANGIFHMAALPNVQHSIENPIGTLNANLISTIKMLEVARKHSIKFVYSGSCSCYGDATTIPTNENESIKPLSPYALNKYQGEQYCRLYSKIYDIETICLRYFNVYGCRMTEVGAYRSVLSIFFESYNRKKPLNIVNDGKQKRDFVHVFDVISANLLAMSCANRLGDPINIGSGQNYSVNEIADMFGEDKKYGEKRIEPQSTLADITVAKKLLNWEPKFNLKEWIYNALYK
jgi:UDP-glucose 4-epimerase|tara:strand:+ start:469 stop:1365 length:897 start_codon:yes stop_codon:yes gene_type:complete